MNKRFEQVRKASKLNQSDFGSKIGVTGASISRIESGDRQPSEMVIRAVCEKFNINRQWLETGEGEMLDPQLDNDIESVVSIMHGQSEIKKHLVRTIAAMPDDLLDAVLAYFRATKKGQ